MSERFKCPPTDLRGYWGEGKEVTYAVSYSYNGGIVIENKWYDGYEVPPPLLPAGYAIVGIGVGYQLNARPPLATGYLKPLSKVKDQLYMDGNGEWKHDRTANPEIYENR